MEAHFWMTYRIAPQLVAYVDVFFESTLQVFRMVSTSCTMLHFDLIPICSHTFPIFKPEQR